MDFSDLKNIFNANCFPIDQSALKEVGEGNVVVQSVPIDGGGVDSCCVMRIDPNFKDPFPYFKAYVIISFLLVQIRKYMYC